MRWTRTLAIAVAAVIGATAAMDAAAQEFRRFQPIARPEAPPPGFERVEPIDPVSGAMAEKAAKEIIASWNGPGLGEYVAEDFVDRDRLMDSMIEDVPRDANIRVLSTRSPQTVQQFRSTAGGAQQTVSIVSVVAETQIEFQDPNAGFRRLRGENELLLRIVEERR